ESLSNFLKQHGIAHEVLNAKQHEREAMIVAQAGRPGAVTIATNMAGRGTDIVLGGSLEVELHALADENGEVDEELKAKTRAEWQKRHDEVLAAGGLHIVGTERHESRRIDNQLRGRSGRQGDPGSSRFYLSIEDNLMRIFGDPERTKRWLQTAGMREGEVIESRLLSRQIERAQRKVEAHNFDARKNLLEYDDVANDQRKVIYHQRSEIMAADDLSDAVAGIREEVITGIVDRYVPQQSLDDQWDLDGLAKQIGQDFAVQIDLKTWLSQQKAPTSEDVAEFVNNSVTEAYQVKVVTYGEPVMRHLEKTIMMQALDSHWREHLAAMDYLRQGIHLRSYAQKNPKQEYKREAFELFSSMLDRIKHDTVSLLSRVQVRSEAEIQAQEEERQRRLEQALQTRHAAPESLIAPQVQPAEPEQPAEPFIRQGRKLGRNELCPCGSGKKFKNCHGALEDGERVAAIASSDGVGRNDPCPCGSGKKYKHCHGNIDA
ncbi:MAG TPA: SEC-C metal-binding domain-containing protein, partial [Steroidobacteraceae bacterium]|nr:SEC-C metal-binding domain-containing protein [Steroidobacteraceae bacterium]